jgi:hypothetical protein
MVRLSLAYAAVVACTSSAIVEPALSGETRAVLELFTSQGCSSCPPADKLLGELASDPSLISISLPIDYWDYLGWKDTLADPRHSARQRAYSGVRGDREVYTPQVVVNGSVHALGSSKNSIEKAVAKSRVNPATLSLPVQASFANGVLSVSLPERGGLSTSAEIWITAVSHAVSVTIQRGENRGKTITYHNVARRWLRLGQWQGKANSWTIPLRDFAADGVDGASVFVQSGTVEKPAAILGATSLALR